MEDSPITPTHNAPTRKSSKGRFVFQRAKEPFLKQIRRRTASSATKETLAADYSDDALVSPLSQSQDEGLSPLRHSSHDNSQSYHTPPKSVLKHRCNSVPIECAKERASPRSLDEIELHLVQRDAASRDRKLGGCFPSMGLGNDNRSKGDSGVILKKIPCVHWPKKRRFPLSPRQFSLPEDGHLMCTPNSLYFAGLRGSQFSWSWNNISVQKATTMNGRVQNAIRIKPCHDDLNNLDNMIDDESDSEEDGGTISRPSSTLFTFAAEGRDAAVLDLEEFIINSATASSPQLGIMVLSDDGETDYSYPVVSPDPTLQKMKIILKKKLHGVSVMDFYDICWSEGMMTDRTPFYGPWLETSGKQNVSVGAWEFATGNSSMGSRHSGDTNREFVGPWDGECYEQKRTVTFRFSRAGSLFTGPPVADVKQIQRCRVDRNDRCVLSMTIQMAGIPFANSFSVEIRWVATRIGANDLSLVVGLHVNFHKFTIVESRIREGVTCETKKTQSSLYQHVKEACSVLDGETVVEEETVTDDDQLIYESVVPFHTKPHTVNGDNGGCFCAAPDWIVKALKGDQWSSFLECGDTEAVVEEINIANRTLSQIKEAITVSSASANPGVTNHRHVRSELREVNVSLQRVLSELDE